MFCISEKHLQEYHRDGVTVCRGVLNSEAVQTIKQEVERLALRPSPYAIVHKDRNDDGMFLIDIMLHRMSPMLLQLALDSHISRLAKAFLPEGSAYFFYDQLFIKAPNTTTRTQWHQDLPFWPLEGNDIPSLWLALSPCNAQTSSVAYLPGSHLGRIYTASISEERELDRANGIDICPDIHLDKLLKMKLRQHSLEAGDVVVHHPLVIHGAGPNLGSTPRIALSLRYCSGNIRWSPRARTMQFPGTQNMAAGCLFTEQSVFPLLT